MALFTDIDIVTLDDLLEFESSLVQVSSSHGIDVETKIKLATDAISDKLMLWLLKVGASDPQWLSRRTLGLSTVVMTPSLHRWACFDSLSRFFAEAYNVQLNTRFQSKWTEYQGQAADAADMVFLSGVGIVYQPLSRPELPAVSITTGNNQGQPFFLQTAWADSFGNESAPSPINAIILPPSSGLTVTTNLVVPPTAIGWNLYASTTQDGLGRQNVNPIAIGSAWQLPNTGLTSGSPPTGGQQPNFYIPLSRQIQRG